MRRVTKSEGGAGWGRKGWWALVGLTALVVGLVGFLGGRLWAYYEPARPFETCVGTSRVLAKYLRGVDAVTRELGEDAVSDPSVRVGWSGVGSALRMTECEPRRVVAGIEWGELSPASQTLLSEQLAQWALTVEIPNLPTEAAEMLEELRTSSLESPPSVAVEGLEGRWVVVFAEEDCPCLDTLEEVAQERGVTVGVVRTGLGAVQVAQDRGWDLIDDSRVDWAQVGLSGGGAAVTENGVAVAWVRGEAEVSDRDLWEWHLAYPMDRTAEVVADDLLFRILGCDGYRVAGIIHSGSDRPMEVAVVTDVATEFAEDGRVIPNPVIHYLGEIEAWGFVTFDSLTGSAYYAPCEVQVLGRYTDGEWMGTSHDPGEIPEEKKIDPSNLIDLDSLPEFVEPSAVYPRPSDMTPVANGR